MICPGFGTTHDLDDSQIPPIYPSHSDIVDQMLVLRTGMYLVCLVASREAEYGVCDKKITLGAGLKKQ